MSKLRDGYRFKIAAVCFAAYLILFLVVDITCKSNIFTAFRLLIEYILFDFGLRYKPKEFIENF